MYLLNIQAPLKILPSSSSKWIQFLQLRKPFLHFSCTKRFISTFCVQVHYRALQQRLIHPFTVSRVFQYLPDVLDFRLQPHNPITVRESMHNYRPSWAAWPHCTNQKLVVEPQRLVVWICARSLSDEVELGVEHLPPARVVSALLLELPRDEPAAAVPRREVGQICAHEPARVRELRVRAAGASEGLEAADDEAPVGPAVEVACVAGEHLGHE